MPPRGPPPPQHPYQQPGMPPFGMPGQQPGQPTPFLPQPTAYGAQQHLDPYAQPAPGSFPMAAPQGVQGPFLPADPLMAVGTSMLQQSGKTYFESGRRYMQSWTGVVSGGMLHYHFDINTEYVRAKLLMLVAPFLRRWSYTRVLEQITGGHKYLPPRQDVNAPDLYIPFMAACTFCLLASVSKMLSGRFTPETMYATVSEGFGPWAMHWVVLKALMYALGTPSAVSFLELAAYSGYPFVAICLAMLAQLTLGVWGFRVVWLYGAATAGIVLVRTLKRVVFYESRQYAVDASRHNYLLLALWLFQFPFTWWLAARR